MALTAEIAGAQPKAPAHHPHEELGVRHIDAFVRRVATQPLNPQEFARAKGDVISGASLLMGRVRKIIVARHQAGYYDETLATEVDPRAKASIARNLKDIGIH